ncbi:single-stranded DNA-binding protein [Stenotrophomonas maltophilia]|uniref:Single-stranded DNA-binding protein n=1 Tax=Stenotrophomonas maltophilia TaxID=40324 RepID=A0AAP7L0J7_STEMA|nr:single-stranded DNA-binding protein [Stenotrophomonas maltophilia]OBU61226.1 DNA-binding protein [Stenotrophomonas maltophilia]
MKVEVMTDQVEIRSFPARDGRAAVNFREQKAAVIRPGDFSLPFKLTLDDDQQPYKPGVYELCPTSLENSKFGGLEFGRRIRLLTPSPAPGPAAPKA